MTGFHCVLAHCGDSGFMPDPRKAELPGARWKYFCWSHDGLLRVRLDNSWCWCWYLDIENTGTWGFHPWLILLPADKDRMRSMARRLLFTTPYSGVHVLYFRWRCIIDISWICRTNFYAVWYSRVSCRTQFSAIWPASLPAVMDTTGAHQHFVLIFLDFSSHNNVTANYCPWPVRWIMPSWKSLFTTVQILLAMIGYWDWDMESHSLAYSLLWLVGWLMQSHLLYSLRTLDSSRYSSNTQWSWFVQSVFIWKIILPRQRTLLVVIRQALPSSLGSLTYFCNSANTWRRT